MSIFRDFGSSARAHRAPVTVALVVAIIVGFLAVFMRMSPGILQNLAFFSLDALSKPWTFVTYPFLTDSFISVLFACLWLWGIGGWVEHDLGTTRYLTVWFVFSALCALGLWVGALATGSPGILAGAWTPIAAVTIIWGTRNPDAPLTLMFVLPLTGRWMAWLSAAFVFFGTIPPQMAPFAAAPLALAYFFAANKLPRISYKGGPRGIRGENASGTRRVYRQEYYDEVKRREIAREERERLRKLFEESVSEEEEK